MGIVYLYTKPSKQNPDSCHTAARGPPLRGLPHVQRVEIAGCGHFPHFTHPELLAELLQQFLTPP
jgi:pimeloyl-ACP methyl ester carboxylesterase